ncbi:MAG: DUF1173 family protein [Roseateles sp.]|uniref:DUF1173 family protein n=1 Tax=Roseateles sp. TaxID=1971397 RepID=UPI00403507D9
MDDDRDAAGQAVYEIGGQQYDLTTPGYSEAVARAHAMQQRPRCMCMPGGVETYVARLSGGYVVKRMPDTGDQHAPSCPHFEVAADASGLGALLGTAIREDPVTGLTALKLDFSLSRSPQRLASRDTSVRALATAPSCPRLSLRGLLLYLWEQAGLTRWQPSFAGKRSWATVRRRLLQAAGNKIVGGRPLLDRLFVPEPFSVEQREALGRRRAAFWAMAAPNSAGSGQRLLLIGELKEIVPARCGFKAIVKQVPDQAFVIDEHLYGRISRCLQPEISLWNAGDDIRMMSIATFSIGASGVPTIVELALAPATREWIPINDAFEQHLVERLVAERRSFLKIARINPRGRGLITSATLLDCPDSPSNLLVDVNADQPFNPDATQELKPDRKWIWHVAEGPMAALPQRQGASVRHG